MIDSRFPPQPEKIHFPMYALKNNFEFRAIVNLLLSKKNPKTELLSFIKDYFPNVDGMSYFRNTASSCIADYLIFKRHQLGRAPIVALPAFCCPHFCMRIVNTGAKIVFLDIDSNYGISIESAAFAKSQGADILIWPSYFGARVRSENVISYIEDLHIEIIFDEAQSFPSGVFSSKHPSLISFGHSKRVQGVGGGLMYFPETKDGFPPPCSIVNGSTSMCKIIWNSLFETLGQRVVSSLPANLKYKVCGYQKELPSLLEVITQSRSEVLSSDMSEIQYYICLERIKTLRTSSESMYRIFYALCEFISSRVGGRALDVISGIVGLPTVFALRIQNNKRYEFCAELAQLGIQTTWYYYPLNMVSKFSHFPCEEIYNTRRLSAEIVVLPFGLGSVAHNSMDYIEVLRV